MWEMHDRLEGSVTEETCKCELESFAKHGQLVPVLGRRITGDPDFDVELIYGARRLFVARQLNAKLMVELRRMTHKEAIVAMDIENRQRQDISPYERGVSYASWLRAGYFSSQEEIARTLKISASQVCRLLKIAQLPAVINNAFASPTEMREGWGLRLAEALEKPEVRDNLLRAARAIGAMQKKPPAEEIYRKLLSVAGRGRQIPKPAHDEIVRDDDGRALFRIRHKRASIALIVPLEKVSPSDLRRIRDAVADVLKEKSAWADRGPRAPAAGDSTMMRVSRSVSSGAQEAADMG
jgi:ParB family transcriptional regulator, chromosome partitioning protein